MLQRSNRFALFLLVAFIFNLLLPGRFVRATDYTSTNFGVRDPVQSTVGGDSSSTNFQHIGTGSLGAESQDASSTNFKLQSGFLYFSSSTLLTQNRYRWYMNVNSVVPSTPLAAENTAITGVSYGLTFRLQLSLKAAGEPYPSGKTFKLQYGDKTNQSQCSSISTWTDLGGTSGSTYFRGYDNTPADGASTGENLLTTAASGSSQTYEESNPTASTPNPIYVGNNADSEWSWVIENYQAPAYTTYCFRMVRGDGTALDTYSTYPEVTTENASIDYSISSNSLSLGTITSSAVSTNSHTVTVTTNAHYGYYLYVHDDGNLRVGASDINDVTDGTVSAGSEEYGLNTLYGEFVTDGAITTSQKLARSVSTATFNSVTTCTYKASVSPATAPGSYSHAVRYTLSGAF